MDEGLKVFGMKGSEAFQSFVQRLWMKGSITLLKDLDEGLKVFGMKGSEGFQSSVQRLGMKGSKTLLKDFG